MSKNYENQNAYSENHFPEHWNDEDFEFLASFLADEFGARLAAVINPERDYDYELFVQAETSSSSPQTKTVYRRSPEFGIEPDLGDEVGPGNPIGPEDVGVE